MALFHPLGEAILQRERVFLWHTLANCARHQQIVQGHLKANPGQRGPLATGQAAAGEAVQCDGANPA